MVHQTHWDLDTVEYYKSLIYAATQHPAHWDYRYTSSKTWSIHPLAISADVFINTTSPYPNHWTTDVEILLETNGDYTLGTIKYGDRFGEITALGDIGRLILEPKPTFGYTDAGLVLWEHLYSKENQCIFSHVDGNTSRLKIEFVVDGVCLAMAVVSRLPTESDYGIINYVLPTRGSCVWT